MSSLTITTSNTIHKRKLLVASAYAKTSKVTVLDPSDSEISGATKVTIQKSNVEAEFIGPCLRAIAGTVGSGAGLLGGNPVEEGEVDSWLETVEGEAEMKKGKALISFIQSQVESHLTTRTFLVGDSITLADISLSLSLYPLMTSSPPKDCINTMRWFKTCVNQKEFKTVLESESSKESSKSLKDASVAGSSGAGGSSSSSSTAAPSDLMLKPGDRPLVASYSQCGGEIGGRTKIGRIHLLPDQGESLIGKKLTICGWVKKIREQAELCFLEINDGSCHQDMQVVIDKTAKGFSTLKGNCNTGASVKCIGTLVSSPAKGQKVEFSLKDANTDEVRVLGSVDAAMYPLPPKRHTMEHLRDNGHLRPRSNLIGAVARIRSNLAYATHEFFRRKNFLYVHTPLITASDCEGAGEMFQVTTMLDSWAKGDVPIPYKTIEDLKKGLSASPNSEQGEALYKGDFFRKKSYLTVSGQLAVENYCCSLSDVYTFGPTFRAENSHTPRHLAEFWMIEPEIAYADILDVMQCAEDYLKFCVQYAMDNCRQDLEFFDSMVEKGLIKRLENLLENPFGRITYTEVIELLEKDVKNGKFAKYLAAKEANYPKKDHPKLLIIEWGMDLHSSHERYVAEEIYKRPVAVYNYPADLKAFYMRANSKVSEDGKTTVWADPKRKTVAAMDVLAPLVGEVIGGSQREERYNVLVEKLKENDLDERDYWWYLDLRRYGSVPHGGFGLGFERLIMLTTGVDNIREVIPYPRWPGNAKF